MSTTEDFDLVLFGASGDLAMRKLLPAFYQMREVGVMGGTSRVIGAARSSWSREEFLGKVEASCREFLTADGFSDEGFQGFSEHLDYQPVDGGNPEHFAQLAERLAGKDERVRVFFLSTAPSLFTKICENLAAAGLITPRSRVVLEKPLGRDLASAQEISRQVGSVFDEHQVYRIDHYLGKEPVQNLMALRFGNALFEPLWRSRWIRDVQITAAETVGVEGRGEFYDRTGALRDMVQNHLLQLLSIIAMEPPISVDPDTIRDEKLRVLRALRPITVREVAAKTVRGQYKAGAADGRPVPGYLQEPGIPPDSHNETFVALKAEIDNWRWAGVPFFLRTGKRMTDRVSEIIVNFNEVPHFIFDVPRSSSLVNRLVIQLHPKEEIRLYLMAKAPGEGMKLRQVSLSLNFAETFKGRRVSPYERLITDVVRGNLTLFVRRDELDAAWRWVDPILEGWEALDEAPKPYTAGSWGPAAATALTGRENLTWHEED